MKTTVINLEGVESVLSPAGVEKQLCKHPGIHKVETNFMTGTATVYHDESMTLAEIKRYVAECGYGCSGECLPQHVCKPGDPPAAMAEAAHTEHAVKPAAKADAHAGHEMAAPGEMEAMAHEMGHGTDISMEGMVRDMRNRFLVSFILAIPVFLYSPLFTDFFKMQFPLPFGLSNEILSFLLATPAVLYGGWVFYIGAWRGLKNRTLNMAVLVALSVLAGYIFSVAATFFFDGEVFYEAAVLLLAFVLFGHWMEMRARCRRIAGHSSPDESRTAQSHRHPGRSDRRSANLGSRARTTSSSSAPATKSRWMASSSRASRAWMSR